MPRQKSLITIIREFVQEEVRRVMGGLLGTLGSKEALPRMAVGVAVEGLDVHRAQRTSVKGLLNVHCLKWEH